MRNIEKYGFIFAGIIILWVIIVFMFTQRETQLNTMIHPVNIPATSTPQMPATSTSTSSHIDERDNPPDFREILGVVTTKTQNSVVLRYGMWDSNESFETEIFLLDTSEIFTKKYLSDGTQEDTPVTVDNIQVGQTLYITLNKSFLQSTPVAKEVYILIVHKNE